MALDEGSVPGEEGRMRRREDEYLKEASSSPGSPGPPRTSAPVTRVHLAPYSPAPQGGAEPSAERPVSVGDGQTIESLCEAAINNSSKDVWVSWGINRTVPPVQLYIIFGWLVGATGMVNGMPEAQPLAGGLTPKEACSQTDEASVRHNPSVRETSEDRRRFKASMVDTSAASPLTVSL
ncbi:hypothetical protein CRENBAI_006021 [Crenichthys baileyi]|uniref:Uncharacterized protein n=1 Tax=Crenichthys baileyi TaxID=28760 RepID=A0AAV9S926_9TELE